MCFGLPERKTITTTERVTTPLYLFAFHVGATSPALTSVRMSGSSEKSTTSAGSPLTTACAWSADGPYDCVKSTPCPTGVCWKAGMIFEKASLGVEYATSDRVVSVVRAPAAGATRAASSVVSRAMRRTCLLCRSVWSSMKQANARDNELSNENRRVARRRRVYDGPQEPPPSGRRRNDRRPDRRQDFSERTGRSTRPLRADAASAHRDGPRRRRQARRVAAHQDERPRADHRRTARRSLRRLNQAFSAATMRLPRRRSSAGRALHS